MEQTAGQSSGSDLSVQSLDQLTKKSSSLQLNLTHFKSNHNQFILYAKGQNYTIIKKVTLKV